MQTDYCTLEIGKSRGEGSACFRNILMVKKTATVGIAMRPELNCTQHRRRKEGKGENPRATKKEIEVDEVKGGWKNRDINGSNRNREEEPDGTEREEAEGLEWSCTQIGAKMGFN